MHIESIVRRLREQAEHLAPELIGNDADLRITGLAYHSKHTSPGDLFFCFPGTRTDGHRFADEALKAGAVALVVQREVQVSRAVPIVRVTDVRQAAARVAQQFFGEPSRELLLIGVTGTSGKTTTSHIVRHLLEVSGRPTGMLGTLGRVVAGQFTAGELTTPEAIDVQRSLRQMVDAGDRAAVMEVSSHSLMLDRVWGSAFDVGVFTNLAPEHLDFHQTMDQYLHAKARLFPMVGHYPKPGIPSFAVINRDDPHSHRLQPHLPERVITFGLKDADVTAAKVELHPTHSVFDLCLPSAMALSVTLPLPGGYNVMNALAAAAVGWGLGLELNSLKAGLESMEAVPGRFERVSRDGDPTVIVDFAHTGDELHDLLRAVRQLAPGKVWVLFGCGGARDPGKRPAMGAVAERLADVVVVTSDNPRGEDPAHIATEILRGMNCPEQALLILDRAEAIRFAVSQAAPEDTVVLAGKGHETYQILADETLFFDDREEARRALQVRRQGGDSS